MKRALEYFRGSSAQAALLAGTLMYVSYAFGHQAWANPALIGVGIFVALMLPRYSKWCNQLEEQVQLKTACVTLGRLVRYVPQLAFNTVIFWILTRGQVVPNANLSPLGGVLATAALTTAASQGIQYVALSLASRELGDKNRNVITGLTINILVTAAATFGLAPLRSVFSALGFGFGGLVFGLGLASDLRSWRAPRGGVGIFFGTFNPFHKTHLRLIKEFIADRGLEKVYLHCTVVPKLHRDAMKRGEIVIARREDGMRIYEKTAKADPYANYFPTGKAFFEYETRRKLIELAIRDAGLEDWVELLSEPEIYERRGFYGIIAAIKKLHPGMRLHGLHGSDLGGMWVRSIYDECGFIYPYPVRRVDGVSATAVRNGVSGLTPEIVEQILPHLRQDKTHFTIRNLTFTFEEGVLTHA